MRGRGRQKGSGGIVRRAGRPGKKERTQAKAAPQKGGGESALRAGDLRLHRDGYGFVISARAGEDDVFVPARFMGDALGGDLVEVRTAPGRGGKVEGRIVRVVERRVMRLMGRLERSGSGLQVITDDQRVRHRIVVPQEKRGGAKAGDNVVVRILSYPSGSAQMVGEVVEILGQRGDDATEKSAVMTRHQLSRGFPPAVLKDADAAFRLMDEGEIASRRDLRDVPFVTIDGESAKDFDDAVAVERIEGGLIRLWVSIADVSHFVRPQTALDGAAYERGTSVYFPGDCLPMLPEQLSNILCSLKPDEDRLTMTAEMDIDGQGNTVRTSFCRSVIQSRERMTYTAVKKILVDRDAPTCDRYRKLLPAFELMEECYKRMRAKRLRCGSIDFDLPEPEIVIDMQGDVSDIVRAQRYVSHMMIEEFMIAANEAVAEFLTKRRAGCIYRIHEPPPPDRLREFSILLHNLGYKFRFDADAPPQSLAEVVEKVRGTPEERLVNHMLLRSMSRAVYSAENKGHYGLVSRCYCHFTSPIRRYPDLVVHRLLTRALNVEAQVRGSKDAQKRPLEEISGHCSRRERIAMDAEREMAKLYATMFMQAHVGDKFEGVVSHLTKFGFFVELIDFFVEGLVRIEALSDDRYRFEEAGMLIRGQKKKRAFKIGDRVLIEVSEVDIPAREILFLPV
ncbi:MAG: ribonuclease R [Pseudomonadota bacterium]